jgi:serine protease Do
VFRKGAQKELTVTVAEMPDEAATQPRRGTPPSKEKAKPNKMGLVLSDLTEEQKKEAEVKAGVAIDDIAPTVRGNVQPGDVIIAIVRGGQSTEAKSAAQVNEALAKVEKGASVTLQLKRGNQQFFSTLKALNGE